MGLIQFIILLNQVVAAAEPPTELLITTDSTEYTIDTTGLFTIDTTDTSI